MLRFIVISFVAMWTGHLAAQSTIDTALLETGGPNAPMVWEMFTGINSASLASQGAELVTSTAIDGVVGASEQKAIVTFWRPTQDPYVWAELVRCIDYFDSFMRSNGGACSIPQSQE